ncbi:polysaccharide pyruvyl transferase family protein [Solitalea longa]|uniref:Polysaccharide pyruvyl transferase family protein n=1 Tax=Solitalea longa TaxID=2079460 RepID=A0A2S5AAJ2_9SPHI|nr:polysaccharide pyruvyl transferase family protein [Solitalea longa]POY39247.1 polysaccharide pyruvyl transferase family protein [Solitalea longa]
MSKKTKIAIVWANPYNKNLGVAALAYSSLALLYDVVKENNLNADFSFFGSSTRNEDEITINNQKIIFDNFLGMRFFHWTAFVKLNIFPNKFKAKKLHEFDYIFDIAEGDSFTDIYGDDRFWRILNSKKFFYGLNKKQVLLPQTIGPFNKKEHEVEAFEVMKKLDKVISRDKKSFEYSAKFLPIDKIIEMIDVAFYLPFEKVNFDNNKINVGINISGLLWNGGYTRSNQFNMKTDYKELIRNTLEFFSQQENVVVHLVPHVIPVDYPVEDDYVVAEEIIAEFPDVVLAPRFENPIEAKSYISGMDFFTGARMHACIAAFSTNVAVYPMAYSRKFNGLFEDTLNYKWMGDCVNSSAEEVLEGLKEAFAKRDTLSEQIELSLKEVVKPRLLQLKELIFETLNN